MRAAEPTGREGARPTPRGRGDAGATLILALVFLVVVSATVISLTSWAQGDLNSTRSFVGAQNFQSAADSATNVAIQFVQYNFLDESLNASPPTLCWASNGPATLTFNAESVDSWCSTRVFRGTSAYRIVTISTCLSSASRAACERAPLLQAIVKVSDTDSSGNFSCSAYTIGSTIPSSAGDTCGRGLTIESWAFDATPPEVSSVAVGGGCSGLSATIAGTAFTNVTAVDAVSATTAGREANLAFPAASFSASGGTQITATFNAIPSGQYDVRVSTSSGSSALVPASSFSC